MKKILLLTLIFPATIAAFAQFTGKPIYNIEVKRSDTLMGNIEVELFPNIAPLHVANWDSIVTSGGYDSTAFHRVAPGFVIQGGDPNSVSGPVSTWGQGNPSQANVPAEFSEVPHARGILSAARATDPNSASSQFFICVANAFNLDNNYSVYGEVISGMSVVDLIVAAPVVSGTERPSDKISMFITKTGSNDSVPESPVLNSPATGTVEVETGTSFSWGSVGDAHLYMFEVATDSAFTNIVYQRHTKNTSSTANGLDGFTDHYWRVRANNGGHFSDGGEVRKFTWGIGAPSLVLPEDSSTTGSKPFFDWADATNAVKYRVQVSTMSSFVNPFLNTIDTVLEGGSEFKAVNDLELNARYYWKVSAVDQSNNESEYSDVWEFTPTELTGISSSGDSYFSVYPNPADQQVYIDVVAPASFSLYGIDGKLVETSRLVPGINKVGIEHLPKGVLFYTLSVKGSEYRGKLMVK